MEIANAARSHAGVDECIARNFAEILLVREEERGKREREEGEEEEKEKRGREGEEKGEGEE